MKTKSICEMQKITEAFLGNKEKISKYSDPYKQLAAIIFDTSPERVTSDQRRKARTCALYVQYGQR